MTGTMDDDIPLLAETTEENSTGLSQTDWSLVATAGEQTDDGAAAMERLAARYWPAIYAFIRASGRTVEESADLTQGYICDVVIGRKLVETADRARGRFRSLMLTSLQNYLRQHHRHETRQKRSQDGKPPLQLADDRGWMGIHFSGPQPADRFTAQWRATLVRRVLEDVRRKCISDGLENHWTVFEHRVVRPMLQGAAPVAYAELLERLQLEDISQASNMMVTVKRRVARALREEVRRTVNDPLQVNNELRDLLGQQELSS